MLETEISFKIKSINNQRDNYLEFFSPAASPKRRFGKTMEPIDMQMSKRI